MGRIRTQMIKRLGSKLIKEHRESFKKDFNDNKKVVEQFLTGSSKKLRNVVAGYVTRLMKEQTE